MRHIGTNNKLLKHLYDDYFWLNKELRNLNLSMSDSNELIIEIIFNIPASEHEKNLKLVFTDIMEYQFVYRAGYAYNPVRRFKFLKEDEIFYISLDPEDELPHVSPTDRGIIRSKTVAGYVF